MKKKLLPITLGLALMAIAGTAYAQTVTTPTTTDTSIHQKAAGDKNRQGGYASMVNQELLTLLKTDQATLQTELKAGKTLAAIGEAAGVTKQQIIDLLVAQDAAKLAQSVTDGKITQAEADTKKAKQLEMATKRVDQAGNMGGKGPGGPGGKGADGRGGHGGPGGQGGIGGGGFGETVATLTGLTAQEIGTQMKAGKSLSEIALEKGVSKQQLIDALVKKETEKITKMVDEKHVPKAAGATTAPTTTP
ncbi:hypothetical protein [Paenibacillus agricola]|uniref:LysM domain-containing protein n=1 Tax=Paenibacillus agricola TaxID=2716264 RepID=A0ABX0JGK8_9BACL|nr:hypothetical protein [Paenibacillus agricola]NHN34032.1 hypothetical protein [Paenibacillus agricola]